MNLYIASIVLLIVTLVFLTLCDDENDRERR